MSRVIVPTGYMGSGSSAVTGLVSEYQNVKNDLGSFEYIFLHCPNGVFDLEDRLLSGNNALRSDEAIRTFETQMRKLYDKKFWWVGNYKQVIGPRFMELTEAYVDSLTSVKYPGFWYAHEEVNFPMFLKLLVRKVGKILTLNRVSFPRVLRYRDGMRIALPTPEEFYEKTRKYIQQVIGEISQDAPDVLLDQLLLPFNLFRMEHYFGEDLICIVVERDPRDLFILNKYIWDERGASVPMPHDVHTFCEYYRRMRQSEKPCVSRQVLRIYFEDLIYRYEDTVSQIEKHLSFTPEMHIHPRERFDPSKSICNTQVFRASKYREDVAVIEKELPEFLYDFPYTLENTVENSAEFD